MEDQLVESYLSSTHRLERLSCYQRDPKTLHRLFDAASIPKLEKELASGEYHAVVVVDLVQDLDIFQNKIGPILQKFVREGVSSDEPGSGHTIRFVLTYLDLREHSHFRLLNFLQSLRLLNCLALNGFLVNMFEQIGWFASKTWSLLKPRLAAT